MTIFYDRLKQAGLKHGDMRAAATNMDFEKRKSILANNRDILIVYPRLVKIQRGLAAGRRQINSIHINPTMSAEDKRDRIDAINERMHRLAKLAVDVSNKAFGISARKESLVKAIRSGTNEDARKALSGTDESGRAISSSEIKSAVAGAMTPRLDRIMKSAPKELRARLYELSKGVD